MDNQSVQEKSSFKDRCLWCSLEIPLYFFSLCFPPLPHLMCLKVRPSSSVTDLPDRKARAAAHSPEKDLSQALLSILVMGQLPGLSLTAPFFPICTRPWVLSCLPSRTCFLCASPGSGIMQAEDGQCLSCGNSLAVLEITAPPRLGRLVPELTAHAGKALPEAGGGCRSYEAVRS